MKVFSLSKFNDWLGDKLANGMTSMKCAWTIAVIISIPLFVRSPQNILEWQQWLVCSVFQGIGLSILGYSGKKEGRETRTLLIQIRDSIFEELGTLRSLLQQLTKIEEVEEKEKIELDEILKQVKENK